MLSNIFFTAMLISSLFFSAYSYNGHLLCLDHQKSLLLQLKNELIFNSSLSTKLVRWNQTHDCCNWNGVHCDSAGHVISLQLDDESISGGIGDSSSLFRLKYLKKLNLAYNQFSYSTPIPKGIHRLNYLTHLDLSNAGFGGQVPFELSFLTRLVSLDIDYFGSESLLILDNLEVLVQNLTGLRHLHLDFVNISSSYERKKWSQIVSSYLPNIRSLSLCGCSLSGPFARSFSQLHSLSTLKLNRNELSTLPSTFANLTQLTNVDLSRNLFMGSLSPTQFQGLSNLVNVDLSHNSFSGNIPHSLFALPSLGYVDLRGNNFTGVQEFSVAVNVSNIFDLDLSSNLLQEFPDSLLQLQSLNTLYLSDNLFSGTVLEKIRRLANLRRLDLSGNNLRVEVRNDNLTSHGFPQLTVLSLASCNLNVFPDFIKHLGMIEFLDLSNNEIGGAIPSWIRGLTQLWELDLSNNVIGGEIPSSIWGLTQLQHLNISYNLLTGLQKPYHIPSSLFQLDLRSNQLSSDLHPLLSPKNMSNLWHLLLANNSFSGPIPSSLCTATQLQTLDLSSNKLSGSIPSCLFDLTNSSLSVVVLGKNNISGRIPDNFPLLSGLNYLDLNNNTLEGKIPKSIKNCQQLEFINVGNNIISDTFPCMLPSSLRVLLLHSNSFHGEVTCDNSSWPHLQILDISSNHFAGSLETINFSSLKGMVQRSDSQLKNEYSIFRGVEGMTVIMTGRAQLSYQTLWGSGVTLIMKGLHVELYEIWKNFSTIDFSCNNFEGDIPNVIGELSSLHHLNLSHNALSGSIPKSFGKLQNLESLDLSRNQLTGAIPMELAEVSFLSFLNLSYNKLVGEIPNDPHFQTFSADSFKGNPELCGFNLNISCTSQTVDLSHENEEEKTKEIEWEYVSAAVGYVVGLGSIVWLLLFCRSFKKKYFDKIDDVVEEMFDARDMRRRRRATARRRAVRNQAVMRRRH